MTEPHVHDEETPDLMQICDVLEVEVGGGWIEIQCHVLDHGKRRHVGLVFDSQEGMQLSGMVLAGLHMQLAEDEKERVQLDKKFRAIDR